MNAKDTGPRLGRGLASLLGDMAVQAPPPPGSVRQVPIDLLEPNPYQPRSTIEPAALEELAQSIRTRGVLQPLLVRPHPSDSARFQIIAGERRWRAAGAAGLHEVPALVRETADADAAAVALVENLQRQDLNPLDEAEGYDRLLRQFGMTQDVLGQAVGKSRTHITNALRLLNLPSAVKEALRKGEISAGHARALLMHPDPEDVLPQVIARALSVRQTEALASRKPGSEIPQSPLAKRGPDTEALEHHLGEKLGLKVRLTFDGARGVIQIHYTDLDQLDNLLKVLLAS